MSMPQLRISAPSLVRQVSVGVTPDRLADDLSRVGPSYRELARRIRSALLEGRLAVSTGLPSERELATAAGLSRTTVAAAYGLLRDDGWLSSVRGSGSRLTFPADTKSAGAWAIGGKIATDDSGAIDLTTASSPAPADEILTAVAAAAQQLPALLRADGYHPLGLRQLREGIARRYTDAHLPTSADEILITNGAQHAWSLILATLSAPGDRVLLECPTYPLALDAVRAARRVPVPIPVRADPSHAWDIDLIAASLRQASPRLAYLIPDFHNPTGALMDADTRARVIAACAGTSTLLVVDESLREVPFPSTGELPPPLAAFDDASRVLTIGSISKSLWGGLRVGWIRTTRTLVNRLGEARSLGDMAGSVLDQLVVLAILENPGTAMLSQATRLAAGCAALLEALAEHLPKWTPTTPSGGASLWVELPGPYASELARMAPGVGVHIVPGPRFGPDGTMDSYLRLPFTAAPEQLTAAVIRLASIDAAAAAARPGIPERWMT
ncbi:PLP-dependent aminotransferase family protein [Nakamurella antarctica]|nr:PLP-dependent aminotransferase family protein [Nakamurella antarctica]